LLGARWKMRNYIRSARTDDLDLLNKIEECVTSFRGVDFYGKESLILDKRQESTGYITR
jgi:hypothetical protein